jgi:cell division protein FtsZ
VEARIMSFSLVEDFVRERSSAVIKVIGVGGAGGNAVNRMVLKELHGVEFIAVNTDVQMLEKALAPSRIQIGPDVTKGLGAGAKPAVGRQAVEESSDQVLEHITGADMVFITAGMGGGTGTGASPVIAKMAKENGALTVAVVTKPFLFEGRKRFRIAEEGIRELKKEVDTLILIPNERVFALIEQNTPLNDAFMQVDDVLYQAVRGISDLITIPGLVNVDFADVQTVMSEMGDAIMGTGYAAGAGRAEEAAQQAISSPLLEDVSIAGARGVLVNICGGNDLTLFDVRDATMVIHDNAGEDSNIIFGAVIDPEQTEGEIQVTVIATGLGESRMPETKDESVCEVATLEFNEIQRKNVDIPAYCRQKEKSPFVVAQETPDTRNVSKETSSMDSQYVAPYMKMLMD